MRIHDITRAMRPGVPVWPGDPDFEMDWPIARDGADGAVVARVRFGTHTATHVDAPFHFLAAGVTIDAVPIETFVGPAVVVEASGRHAIDAELARSVLGHPDCPPRVLFRTGAWGGQTDRFTERFGGISADAATVLVDGGIRLVGTDAPSVDPFDSADHPAHHVLLGAGVCILENLDLDGVPAGEYELIALPLRIEGADASPVRAVLRSR